MGDPLTTTIPTVLEYASKVSGSLLKCFYSEKKLDGFLFLDILATGESLYYKFHSQESSCYLQATNVSPFDFKIDRIKAEVTMEKGGSFSCEAAMPHFVKGLSREAIYMRSRSAMTPQSLQFAKDSSRASVSIEAYVITTIRSFRIQRHYSDVKTVRVSG